MKLLNIALLIGLTSADADTRYLRAAAAGGRGSGDILKDTTCAPIVKESFKELNRIMNEYQIKDIIEHACNAVTLGRAANGCENARKAAATEMNPCAKAMAELRAAAGVNIERYVGHPQVCEAEISDNIASWCTFDNVSEMYICERATPDDDGGAGNVFIF